VVQDQMEVAQGMGEMEDDDGQEDQSARMQKKQEHRDKQKIMNSF